MTRRVPIQLNVANALQWLGTLYRNPAEALKEHISNAIDEHTKAQQRGVASDMCCIRFVLEKNRVVIEYPYGMNRQEFEAALKRVADSAKRTMNIAQIGELGIGIFSFQQVGRRCTFFTKKGPDDETVQVTLKEGADEAEFETALRRNRLDRPGIRIEISDLKCDPTRPRGPLSPEKLTKVFAEKFDGWLRKGWLHIEVCRGAEVHEVKPLVLNLPKLVKQLSTQRLPDQPSKMILLDLYFDPSGKGVVSIRHSGVVVVDDFKQLSSSAYGLEESVFVSGDVKGAIDADFLRPLPARSGFEETGDWMGFLDVLDKLKPMVEAEVEELKQRETERKLSEIQRRAIELAREIFDLDEFKDLELIGGTARQRKPDEQKGVVPTGERTGERSRERGDHVAPKGLRINYQEVPFEEGPRRHSRLLPGGVVQTNSMNPDYRNEMLGPDEAKLAYTALVIGKETIAYNDKSGIVDEYLEGMLGFYFKLKARVGPNVSLAGTRGRGRPKKLV